MQHTREIIEQYYKAFNERKVDALLWLLSDDVIHEINQGKQEIGKKLFEKFMERMNGCYQETASDLVIFTSDSSDHAAAEFTITGKYLSTDKGLPEAKGQTYRLKCGAFFALKKGKISRVTNYYNMQAWLAQVQ
ncbi:MAG: nuclear transport factor 2 family protein [Verrucomicrobia bacterium]|nr:nuclear transport factor 2 family protein [Verrucomicrobiota bacterium]